jgi:hypothetical protein
VAVSSAANARRIADAESAGRGALRARGPEENSPSDARQRNRPVNATADGPAGAQRRSALDGSGSRRRKSTYVFAAMIAPAVAA